jgi:hypothetical protein
MFLLSCVLLRYKIRVNEAFDLVYLASQKKLIACYEQESDADDSGWLGNSQKHKSISY